jgi:MGT family glycosyltransferase
MNVTMARFLIGTAPLTGHVQPMLSVARKLVERDHQVWWYAGRRFESSIAATGARFMALSPAADFDDRDPEAAFPSLRGRSGLDRVKAELAHFFIDSIPDQLADLRSMLRAFPADALLGDSSAAGLALAAETHGLPWATLGVTPLAIRSRDTAPFGMGVRPPRSWPGRLRNRLIEALIRRLLFRAVNAQYRQARALAGLPPRGTYLDAISPFLFLQPTAPAFEYPRSDLPPQTHFIGPLLPAAPKVFNPPVWWNDLRGGRPVVLVNQGTLDTNPVELIVPALRALAEEDVLVVAATGGAPGRCLPLDPLPANARVEPFIPYSQLMPHISAMITNGGYGAVQIALGHGVPLVVAGSTAEKTETAMRVAWFGAGLSLKTNIPDEIRDAARRVLAEPRYREQARRMQCELARHDAPVEAARLLEQLAATKQPVVRL